MQDFGKSRVQVLALLRSMCASPTSHLVPVAGAMPICKYWLQQCMEQLMQPMLCTSNHQSVAGSVVGTQ